MSTNTSAGIGSRPYGRSRSVLGPLLRSGLVLWFVLPLVPLALWAAATHWPYPSILPTQWGLDGWRGALESGATGSAVVSLAVAGAVMVVATPLGAMAARALTFGRVPGGRVVEAILLAPVAFPPFVVVMGLNVVLLRLRIPGPVGLVLVLVVAALPYTTYVMRVAYLGHDLRYEEEARILGAGRLAVLRDVHVPLVLPALTVAAFLAFLVGWCDYIATLLIGGGQLVTLPILLGSTAAGTGNEPVVAALAVLVVAWPLGLYGLTRLIARGRRVTASSLEVLP